MTCLDRYIEEHPNDFAVKIDKSLPVKCPSDYGYAEDPDRCNTNGTDCFRCWHREIPEEQTAYYPRHPLKANTLDYEAEYKKLKAEQEEYRAKFLGLHHELEQKQHEIDILRGMLRVVEAMTGSSIITARPIGG